MDRNGITTGVYRSNLEKDWAMFFVEHGIPFINEPERFGPWLPDFALTDAKALVEIKPTVEIANAEIPAYLPGMQQAFTEKDWDIIVLVGRPEIAGYELGNVIWIADHTMDFWLDKEDGHFYKCERCGRYFFIGAGYWVCRHCGMADGDHHLLLPFDDAPHFTGPVSIDFIKWKDNQLADIPFRAG